MKTPQIEYTSPKLSKAQLSTVVSEFKRISAKYKKLTRSAIVKEATSEDSPLHSLFVWDDSHAAHRWRLHQAGGLLQTVKVRVELVGSRKPIEVRAWVNVVDPDGKSGKQSRRYLHSVEAFSNRGTRQRILEQALSELKMWQLRYDNLVQFAEIFTAIKRVAKKLKRG